MLTKSDISLRISVDKNRPSDPTEITKKRLLARKKGGVDRKKEQLSCCPNRLSFCFYYKYVYVFTLSLSY